MADFDANAYKLVDVSRISSLIGGGANTYPQRSEESRLINRAEDISYLLEGCIRRQKMVDRESFVKDVTKYPVSPFPAMNDLWYAGNALNNCFEEPFTTSRMRGYSHEAYLRNQPYGFALKPNWGSLIPNNTQVFYDIDTLISSFKNTALYESSSPSSAYKYIIKQNDIQQLYERMGNASAIFVPNGQSEQGVSSPKVSSFVAPSNNSFLRTHDFETTSEGTTSEVTESILDSWRHPQMIIQPITTSSTKTVNIQMTYYSKNAAYVKFNDFDDSQITYLSGDDRFVVLVRAVGYDGHDIHHNEWTMYATKQFGGSIQTVLDHGSMYNRFWFGQNFNANSLHAQYSGRATGHGITIEAWCIGRIYADPASVKKWMWPGIA